MNRLIILLVLILPAVASAQAISGFNLNYLYDPDAEIGLQAKTVRTGNIISVYYRMDVLRKEYKSEDYKLTWERRSNINARSGETFRGIDSVLQLSEKMRLGVIRELTEEKPWFAVLQIKNLVTQGVFSFFIAFESNWPVTHYLIQDNLPVMREYVQSGNSYRIGNFNPDRPLYGYYYKRSFLPAPPPFTRNAPEEKVLKADSVFVLKKSEFNPKSPGLYLFQEDTLTASGLAVVVARGPYPKYNTIAGLSGPLIYITTAEEQRDLKTVNNEKSRFDKVILGITKDTERAKTFMRNYYKGIELANRNFTGYKEGWKTDMGMIFTVFGAPTEVSRNTTNEVWYYEGIKTKFIFHRSGSVFAPYNWFLQRDNNFSQPWFSTIDLWRKGRK
ncbi:MAG: GWxTD domain-containing protein [Cyclobacteriaceae bacterium]